MGRDLEVKEQIRVDDRRKQEDGSKGARDECDESERNVSTERVDTRHDATAYRTINVSFSLGNWPMYMVALRYDSLRRRLNRCGSSLNSRNFH